MKEYGADPLACYPDFHEEASHLHNAASLGHVELMEFFILGTSIAPFPSFISFSLVPLCLFSEGAELSRRISHHQLPPIECPTTHPLAAPYLRSFFPVILSPLSLDGCLDVHSKLPILQHPCYRLLNNSSPFSTFLSIPQSVGRLSTR